MRFNPGGWFDATIYLPFTASIGIRTLMESGGNNPMFMEPWSPEQQLVGCVGVNYMEDGGC